MLDNESARRKLVRLEVEKLLGRFDHVLDLDSSWDFLIVHGPNGVGKTKLLELLHYTFAQQFGQIAGLPFKSARFMFDDSSEMIVSRENGHSEEPLFEDHSIGKHISKTSEQLKWDITLSGSERLQYVYDLAVDADDLRQISRLARDFPVDRVASDRWFDHSTGSELNAYELADRYGFPLSLKSEMLTLPHELADLLSSQDVHLIQTQRLLNTDRKSRRIDMLHSIVSQDSTVVSYANDLSATLKRTLAESSRASQELDRSFPSRLFEQSQLQTYTESEMRAHYNDQLELRARLARINILDSSAELQLPDRALDDSELRTLSTYLDDADKKLQTFQPLLDRLELMREIVNDRFLFNTLEIDQEHGFLFREQGSQEQLSPRHLSSGEQHQLVLMYDLIMKVEEYSLVLIDEPEISLHVAWQKAFLDDLTRIAELRHLRFIIATHSPQIIGDWWDRTARLYDSNGS